MSEAISRAIEERPTASETRSEAAKERPNRPELLCPAGTPAALRTAVDAGADAVYCGLARRSNVRNFPGLNFEPDEFAEGVAYAKERGAKVLMAANTFPPGDDLREWRETIDIAAEAGAYAAIIADIGLAAYATEKYPDLRLHLSVQAGAASPEAIRFFITHFNVKRVVLPRILTISEIKALKAEVDCELESFIFGNVGMMAEGRCALTSYVTGVSTNMDGMCSPPEHVRFEERPDGSMSSLLGEFTIDCVGADEKAGYPTICKGRYWNEAHTEPYYAFDEPNTLNIANLLPDLIKAGVTALKIEGRQRSRAYVREVVAAYRVAVDDILAGRVPQLADLVRLTEGRGETKGAYATKGWR